ncbi:MAG: BlaI/MecI/CopY family transcriptional regulator [Planctomycetota bacterium]|jgi:predicted transcriptional regulator
MARPASRHPTDLELEILKIIWREGPSNVREVRGALRGFRKLAYTSVMTIMTIMTKKGYLSRKKKGMCYVYRPRVSREGTIRKMLRDLMDRAFDGSASCLMANLLESKKLSKAEIRELRSLLAEQSG